jgi:hypothetical protein
VIPDEKGYPSDCMEIDIELRNKMVSPIHKSIIHNLEAIRKFLQFPGGYEDVCAGLYTYAVEEYGNILYLKSFCPSSTDSTIIKFPYKMRRKDKGDTGFLNHYRKFKLALRELPDTCKNLNKKGSFTGKALHQCSPKILSQTLKLERRYFLQTLQRIVNLSRSHQTLIGIY